MFQKQYGLVYDTGSVHILLCVQYIDSYGGVPVDCVPVVCVQCFPCVVCCREGVRWGGCRRGAGEWRRRRRGGWEVAGMVE